MRPSALSSLLLALACPGALAAAPPAVQGHAALAGERPAVRADTTELRALRPPWQGGTHRASGPGPVVDREVYGYLPYWEMDYDFPHWELLTTVAWFSVNMNTEGDADDWNGWGGDATEALVAEAHANGVLVTVTITNFSDSSIGALLGDPARRANAIETCLMLMSVHGVDGVNIDFEFVPASAKSDFVTFMSDLKQAVQAAQPNGHAGHVTLAGPAVDWGKAYDYDQLLMHTDGIMIMAYGYHWQGGNPGPISPLYGGGKWGKYAVDFTIDDYLTYGGVENRHKIIVGLPFYGRSWPVASEAIPGTALSSGSAITFDVAAPEAETYGAGWDDDAKNPYYHKWSGGELRQVWYDDQQSFGLKLAYIDEQDLGGLGIWALGYAGTREEYWQEIGDQFGAVVDDPPVDDPPVDDPPVEDPPVDDPPVDDPPVDDPPVDDPPVDDPPVDDPPVDDPPVDDPPEDDPPEDDPGAVGDVEDPVDDGEAASTDPEVADPELAPTPTAMAIKTSTRTRETTRQGCAAGRGAGSGPLAGLALLLVAFVGSIRRRRRAI